MQYSIWDNSFTSGANIYASKFNEVFKQYSTVTTSVAEAFGFGEVEDKASLIAKIKSPTLSTLNVSSIKSTGNVQAASLNVTGAIDAGSNKIICGEIVSSGDISTKGIKCASVDSTGALKGTTLTLSGTISGATSIAATSIGTAATTEFTGKSATMSGSLAAGSLTITNVLTANGTAVTVQKPLTINDTVSMSKTLAVAGNTTLSGTLSIDGITTAKGGLTVGSSYGIDTSGNVKATNIKYSDSSYVELSNSRINIVSDSVYIDAENIITHKNNMCFGSSVTFNLPVVSNSSVSMNSLVVNSSDYNLIGGFILDTDALRRICRVSARETIDKIKIAYPANANQTWTVELPDMRYLTWGALVNMPNVILVGGSSMVNYYNMYVDGSGYIRSNHKSMSGYYLHAGLTYASTEPVRSYEVPSEYYTYYWKSTSSATT